MGAESLTLSAAGMKKRFMIFREFPRRETDQFPKEREMRIDKLEFIESQTFLREYQFLPFFQRPTPI